MYGKTEAKFGLMPGRRTGDAIFVLRQLMQKYRKKRKGLHLVCFDLLKAYNRIPRKKCEGACGRRECRKVCEGVSGYVQRCILTSEDSGRALTQVPSYSRTTSGVGIESIPIQPGMDIVDVIVWNALDLPTT